MERIIKLIEKKNDDGLSHFYINLKKNQKKDKIEIKYKRVFPKPFIKSDGKFEIWHRIFIDKYFKKKDGINKIK